ncbi:hypothetical protein H4R99_000545 [Coemansia sp. RSA 1722]|nr:hypothetical protein LPJ57_001841 [Coemansia sp. RSA 486]KAJ2238091.1 hypothetical protein IWW45_000431 [Coemansia sp. RSA 485]KAJ2603548.1 hypothetical protein GGF39_000041 [Coemansia sp. RSA 1721]KAJ2606150.1 hypothetical protein H4R99_000545 [Coemansia sp. RSA 1722]KAJ2638699.1 hypothetical protein GGF40_001475 [Coemansia sp. RSA 1286]
MSTSVASKYSNLPDIDLEQPDVYETPDVVDSMELDEEPEHPLSEDISTESVTADQAAHRFRLSSGDVQGKTALARYQKSLFRTLQLESLGGGLEVSTGTLLSETKEQRLRRLVYETQELKEQLAANGGDKKEQSENVKLMELVGGLNEELEKLGKTGSDGSLVASSLWQRLAGGNDDGDAVMAEKKHRNKGAEEPSVLEQRIACLEKILGGSAGNVGGSASGLSAGRSLVDSVAKLRQQMDILADPNRIDGIQRRIKQVLVDMDRLDIANTQAARAVAASSSSSSDDKNTVKLDPAAIKKIDQVYEKLTAVDALVELAPATAQRLQSLAKLHVEAADAVSRLSKIEREQGSVKEELGTMKEIAESLKAAIGENSSTLKDNMKNLDSRIAALNERVQSLSSKK